MTHAVLSHGDGFAVSLDTAFVLDRINFHSEAFTPYAAIDPSRVFCRRMPVPPDAPESVSQWAEIEEIDYLQHRATLDPDTFAENFRCRIGVADSAALRFTRKEQYCKLLGRLTAGGYEHADGSYTAGRLKGRSARALVRWRLSDLHFVTATDLESYLDLPTYLARDFGIERERAWRMAWVLVRYALRDDMGAVSDVLSAADAANKKLLDKALVDRIEYTRWIAS